MKKNKKTNDNKFYDKLFKEIKLTPDVVDSTIRFLSSNPNTKLRHQLDVCTWATNIEEIKGRIQFIIYQELVEGYILEQEHEVNQKWKFKQLKKELKIKKG